MVPTSTRTIQVEEVDVRGSQPTPLAGSTVVITGAGSGMGRALAQRLSAYGCAVAAVDVGTDALAQTESLLSGPSLMRTLDVRDRQGLLGLAAEVAEWAPAPIGAVFNNAGVGMSASVAGTPIEDHEWLMSINLDGVITGTRAFLPVLMRQGSGAIVNTSSVFGLAGIPFQSSYCAAKFAVRGFTDSLRQELRGTGVELSLVMPIGVNTELYSGLPETPGFKKPEPTDVAAAIVDALQRRRFEVYIPRSVAAVVRSGYVMPRRMLDAIGRMLHSDETLTTPDHSARAAYEERMRRTIEATPGQAAGAPAPPAAAPEPVQPAAAPEPARETV
jgi:NAD(P)-dependent dehydrogenase (short-subunit alcohol dehydrogenase family)